MKTLIQFEEKFLEYLVSLSDMPWSYINAKPNVTPWTVNKVRGRKTYSLKHGGSVTPTYELELDKAMIDSRNSSGEYDKKENINEYLKHFDKALDYFKAKKINIKEMGIEGEAYLIGNVILEMVTVRKYLLYTTKKSAVILENNIRSMKFLKRIYDLNLINEADQAPPPPGAEIENTAEVPVEEPAEEVVVTPLSPESEVMYIRLLKKAMVMKINPDDIDKISNIGDVNENNAKELFGNMLQIMKSYSNDIDIEL
jgi:hypothetical protein